MLKLNNDRIKIKNCTRHFMFVEILSVTLEPEANTLLFILFKLPIIRSIILLIIDIHFLTLSLKYISRLPAI